MTRTESIAQLQAGPPVDAFVVGGGITGAGIALECARAGLRTAVVEARDYASGTSSRSSRLVHGGLRYLAQGDFRLTRESVRDRTLLRDPPGAVVSASSDEPLLAIDCGTQSVRALLIDLKGNIVAKRQRTDRMASMARGCATR